MSRKIKTSISLSGDVIQKIKSEALRERRSVSQLIELWLEDALTVSEENLRETAAQSGN